MTDLQDECSTDASELNIILLGESGVGKSTFINSCFNYLKYSSFEEAVSTKIDPIIAAKFEITDEEFETKVVEVGSNEDHNECLEVGKAATQNVKIFKFPVEIVDKKYIVRLIDTPGMGDERGVEQDKINCDLILSCLTDYKKMHAFCILLKPNNPRLDAFMKYCIFQIFSRLEFSAVNNIVFVFTNSRGENFSPGKTMGPLRTLLDDIRTTNKLNIPLGKKNIFCMDNETFRYIAAVQSGVKFDSRVEEATKLSWKQSSDDFWRMLLYITLQEPHDLKKTVTVNEAKAMASQLAKPLSDIINSIDDNLRALEINRMELNKANLTKEQLVKEMNIPYIDLEISRLKSPQTVCNEDGCVEQIEVNGIRKYHYKKICCNNCWQTHVTAEIKGSSGLVKCQAFLTALIWFRDTCKHCEHSIKEHQHIYYQTKVVKRIDERKKLNVKNQEDLVKAKENYLGTLAQTTEEYELEKRLILEAAVLVDDYLKKNSIYPIGNPIEDYMKYQLDRARAYNKDDETTRQYKKLLDEYRNQSKQANVNVTADDICELKEKLFALKHFGSKIRQMIDFQQFCVTASLKHKEVEIKNPGFFSAAAKKLKKLF